MSSLPITRYTPEQYLEMERKADFRSEYVNGEILAMAGASPAHNRITLNIGSGFTTRLAETPCEPFATDQAVKISSLRYTYPDVVVACDAQFEKAQIDLLLNPIVIVEVLSPSTQNDDRSWKFEYYRRCPTLKDYVMAAQDRPFVEHYTRHGQDLWTLRELSGLEAVLRLPSINCELSLTEIYARVKFPAEALLPENTP